MLGDDWRGTGLATCLMHELIRSARRMKGMVGFVLAGNAPMLNLAKRLGFAVTASSEGPGVVRVWLNLRAGPVGGTPGAQTAA